MPAPPNPMSLLAEVTYRCPLQCPYCSNPLHLSCYAQELDTSVWLRVLREAAGLGVIQVHFSGGEPLIRKDLPEMVAEATRLDLYSNISTGATVASEAVLMGLKDAGLDNVQVSLLDSNPHGNNWLGGSESFEMKRAAVQIARRLGFPVTLNVVLHRHNLDHIDQVIELAARWKVNTLELAHVQYTGWAFLNRRQLLPSLAQLEGAREVVESARVGMGGGMNILHVMPDYFQPYPKACLHGWGRVFMTVAPDGAVLPCQSAREIPGLEFPNVRAQSLEAIWLDAPVFRRFRGTDWMPEPCRSCDRREIDFGGCRCQAFLLTGDASQTDPICELSPLHDVVAKTMFDAEEDRSTEFHFRTFAAAMHQS